MSQKESVIVKAKPPKEIADEAEKMDDRLSRLRDRIDNASKKLKPPKKT